MPPYKHTELNGHKPRETEHLLNKAALADRLGLKLRGVECLVARRIIPVIRISRRCVRFDWNRVREALDKLEIREIGR